MLLSQRSIRSSLASCGAGAACDTSHIVVHIPMFSTGPRDLKSNSYLRQRNISFIYMVIVTMRSWNSRFRERFRPNILGITRNTWPKREFHEIQFYNLKCSIHTFLHQYPRSEHQVEWATRDPPEPHQEWKSFSVIHHHHQNLPLSFHERNCKRGS